MTLIQKLNPINKEVEKKKFLFDPLYNPQFEYAEEVTKEEFEKYGEVSSEYLDLAESIINKVISKYGTESNYLDTVEGRLLTREEVEIGIARYLESLGLQETLTVRFSKNFIARTSVSQSTINLRLPIEHRENSLVSTLNHEIGTHFLKNLNEQKQPWYKKRAEFNLRNHLPTEEGLAVINYYHSLKEKYLWLQALYYFAAAKSAQLNFSELFKVLEKYVDNKERRFKICLRMKRGIDDTSVPGVFTKDQVYLTGVIAVIKWLKEHNYDPSLLYLGKIALEDIEKVSTIAVIDSLLLPDFAQKNAVHKASVEEIRKTNGLMHL